MDDIQAIEELRRAFASDPDLAPVADSIRVILGEQWRIEGEVGSIAAKRKAVRVARRVLPGIEFEDGLILDRRKRQSDEGLAEALREALRAEPAFADVPILDPGSHPPPLQRPWIGVMVRNGAIYLGGRLDLAGKALAEGLAWETGACCDVKNLINHENKRPHLDEDIVRAVGTLIAEHPQLKESHIQVRASGGEVTLDGTLAEPDQRAIATALCWFVPNVREVHDRLAVG